MMLPTKMMLTFAILGTSVRWVSASRGVVEFAEEGVGKGEGGDEVTNINTQLSEVNKDLERNQAERVVLEQKKSELETQIKELSAGDESVAVARHNVTQTSYAETAQIQGEESMAGGCDARCQSLRTLCSLYKPKVVSGKAHGVELTIECKKEKTHTMSKDEYWYKVEVVGSGETSTFTSAEGTHMMRPDINGQTYTLFLGKAVGKKGEAVYGPIMFSAWYGQNCDFGIEGRMNKDLSALLVRFGNPIKMMARCPGNKGEDKEWIEIKR